MRNSANMTPREIAGDIIIGWILAAHQGHTDDVIDSDPRESFQRAVRKALRLEIERIAARYRLELGLMLDDD